MRYRTVCLLALVACGAPKRAAPGTDAAPAAPDAAPAAVRPAPPSKEARRAYRQHLAAGRRHGAKSEWGEARVDFEAALAAIPHDGRALSELAWAAFNAGDHERARQAGREAVAAAGDPRLKASSLYNLGRVEEASARKDQAARLYRESLALRPSRTVTERLAGLGKEVEAEGAGTGLPCPEPRPADKLCECLGSFAEAWDRDTPADARACEVEAAPGLADWSIVHATLSPDTESVYLATRGEAGWTIVAELADVFNPGAFGVSETWKLVSIHERALGERHVVEVVGQLDRSDSDAGIAEVESESTTRLTVCVVGANGAPSTCPLEVPTKLAYRREKLDFGDEGGGAAEELDEETKQMQTPGLPIVRSAELRVDLAADGSASVQLVKGSADDAFRALLGPHRLW